MIQKSKVTIHMVSSLDGFIATKDNDVSWLESSDHYEKGVTLTQEDVTTFINAIDCYVMGARTYEHALSLGWPYGDTNVVVLSHKDLPNDNVNVTFYSGELDILINDQLKREYKNIWLVGGAMLTKECIRLELADDIIVSMMPVILGGGILFFDYIDKKVQLHLKDVTTYKDGMVEVWYEIKKE